MRTRPARILPGCDYCNEDHDPAITCRNIADCMQQELPKATRRKRITQAIRDPSGKLVAVRTSEIREDNGL